MPCDESIYEFGQYQLNPAEHLLSCDGKAIPVTAKAFQTLLVLVRNCGHLVDRSQLLSEVWGETFVEEANLSVTISMLRKALGDDRSDHKYIETVAKQGYRFLPKVTKFNAPAPSAESQSVAAPISEPTLRLDQPANRGNRLFWWVSLPLGLAVLTSAVLYVTFTWHVAAGATSNSVPPEITGGRPAAGLRNLPESPVKEAAPNRDANQLYTEGRFFWNKRTEEGFRKSIECFQQAVLKDQGFADAYAGLADSYTLLASYGVEPATEAYPNAKAAALKALQLNDSLAEAHTSLGMVELYYEWNWTEADKQFKKAIALNPNYPLAHTWDALFLAATGQHALALQEAQRARDLDPVSLMANTELGRVYYWNRQYDKAIACFRHALELDPYFPRAHTRLGMALAADGDYSDAIREFEEAGKVSSHDPYLYGLLGYAKARSGNSQAARKMLADLMERSHREYVPAFSVALLDIGLGNREQALDWLEKAYQDRSTYMVYANIDPLLDSVRPDPRFKKLMERMAFPPKQVALAATTEPGVRTAARSIN